MTNRMWLLIGLFCVGCSARVPLYPVSGTVEYQGKPLTTGTVAFHHDDGVSPLAKGEIQADGKFTLGTYSPDDGAVPGKYTVTVTSMLPGHGVEGQDADYRPPKPLIPIKFMRLLETPLQATVEEKENVIKLSISP